VVPARQRTLSANEDNASEYQNVHLVLKAAVCIRLFFIGSVENY
jgi:hypothetical protein